MSHRSSTNRSPLLGQSRSRFRTRLRRAHRKGPWIAAAVFSTLVGAMIVGSWNGSTERANATRRVIAVSDRTDLARPGTAPTIVSHVGEVGERTPPVQAKAENGAQGSEPMQVAADEMPSRNPKRVERVASPDTDSYKPPAPRRRARQQCRSRSYWSEPHGECRLKRYGSVAPRVVTYTVTAVQTARPAGLWPVARR
jgi:hypothetical protein